MTTNNSNVLNWQDGTINLTGALASFSPPDGLEWDVRTSSWRAPGYRYRDLVLSLKDKEIDVVDDCRHYDSLSLQIQNPMVPRRHQSASLDAWLKAKGRGVVELPTGSGKSYLAMLAMEKVQRATLVVVPTIDLVRQWQTNVSNAFGIEVGALGGGDRNILPITVSTYESAYLYKDVIGNKFGFLIFDECHHLPSDTNQNIAMSYIAPYRLGLSATVERNDGRESVIYELLGDLVYRSYISDLEDKVLAPYDVVSISVEMNDSEKEQYKAARKIYTDFLKAARVNFNTPAGWGDFLRKAARMPGGRSAMKAFREQKHLAQAASGKLVELWRILLRHKSDRIIVFTEDNAMAYRIGEQMFLPVLTHLTRGLERKSMLAAFATGELSVIVTSKVLNEGVDVPEAAVGVVVSGSGGVREHVQRLGRILRHQPGKRAIMYELVTKDTNEKYTNQRRRQHDAYQRSP